MKAQQVSQGLLSILILWGLVFGFPIAVASTIGNPDSGPVLFGGSVWSAVRGHGPLSLMLVMTLVMLATLWAVLVLSILKEVVGQLRGVSSPPIPGFHTPQAAARRMVGSASLLVTSTLSRADAAEGSEEMRHGPDRTGAPRSGDIEQDSNDAPLAQPSSRSSGGYRVMPGDSLWSIAYTELGQGSRWEEIAGLNRPLLGDRPGFLTPGLELHLPPVALPAPPSRAERRPKSEPRYYIHSAREGETLSSIAANWLGDPRRYPEILNASRDIIQPGGWRLLDSALLDVGWKVAIPRDDPQERAEPTGNAASTVESRDPQDRDHEGDQ